MVPSFRQYLTAETSQPQNGGKPQGNYPQLGSGFTTYKKAQAAIGRD
jgi:hypothetical protein